MANVYKAQFTWDGLASGAGANTFYLNQSPSDLAAFHTFYEAIAAGIPSGTIIHYPAGGEELDAAAGHLTGAYAVAVEPQTDCTGGGEYASGVGYVVRWNTGVVVRHKRLIGRTFLVPLVGSAFGDSGDPKPEFVGVVSMAATALIADCAGTLGVWSRPKTGPDGQIVAVTSAQVSVRPAFLKSRRS